MILDRRKKESEERQLFAESFAGWKQARNRLAKSFMPLPVEASSVDVDTPETSQYETELAFLNEKIPNFSESNPNLELDDLLKFKKQMGWTTK